LDFWVRFSGRESVLAIRAAILALTMGLLVLPIAPAGATRQSQARAHDCASYRPNTVVVPASLSGLERSSTLARFAPWKARPKMLPGESNDQLSDEIELRSVLLPGAPTLPFSTTATMSRLPAVAPLRC
jgi:hypothetical protein